eukprot:Phypoly_transcript_16587.p1 GENE.Phypoly_transcript_16587~~Phypoly_transcript_16587.p1  ORF type:complete len:282 (+),score=91.20 Phypoly_transcript_16587:42-848(+)
MSALTRATTRVCMRPLMCRPLVRCISQANVTSSEHSDVHRERLLQVVKESVKTQTEIFKRERAKKEREEEYANTIREIMYKTGKVVPPRAPRVYKIVKPREIKQKMREQINEVLISKFHKHTPIEEVKSFLEVVGLHPKRIELENKPSAQWLNAYVTLPENEILTALKMQRLYFKFGNKIVYFLTSPRAEAAFQEKRKAEAAQRRAERAAAAQREIAQKAEEALRLSQEEKRARAARGAREDEKLDAKEKLKKIEMAFKKKKKRDDPI